MWMEHHAATGREYMRTGFVLNEHLTTEHKHLVNEHLANQIAPPPVSTPPVSSNHQLPIEAKKTKVEPVTHGAADAWRMVAVNLKQEEEREPTVSPAKTEMMDTSMRVNIAVANMQVGKMMRALKNPETNQTFWQCTECNYFNKSAKSSKFKVKRHVLKHHVDSLNPQIPALQQQTRPQAPTPPESSDAVWKSHSWMEGTPLGGHTFHTIPQNYQQAQKSQSYQPTTKSQIYQLQAPKQEDYQQQSPRISYLPYEPSNSPSEPVAKPVVKKVKKKPSRLTKEQVEVLMRTLKNVDSGQSYWQCIKCDYFSANPKSSKYRVERHILNKHPLDCAQPTMWVEGRPITINVTPQLYHPLPTSVNTTGTTSNNPSNNQAANSDLAKTEEMARAENLMWSLKDPETGKTFWRCTECEYYNKSEKSSKSKVRMHVMNHHMGRPPKTGRYFPKKEKTEQELLVESLIGSLKDPNTRRTIWLCTKCNYSQSRTGRSNSSKDKMKRHILRKHLMAEKEPTHPVRPSQVPIASGLVNLNRPDPTNPLPIHPVFRT